MADRRKGESRAKQRPENLAISSRRTAGRETCPAANHASLALRRCHSFTCRLLQGFVNSSWYSNPLRMLRSFGQPKVPKQWGSLAAVVPAPPRSNKAFKVSSEAIETTSRHASDSRNRALSHVHQLRDKEKGEAPCCPFFTNFRDSQSGRVLLRNQLDIRNGCLRDVSRGRRLIPS